MAQNINLNSSPYFDDFDATKNYQKVLFKPGIPIQARELTTLQSVLQNQVEKFGKHFFKEGSVVIPGQIAYDPDYFYVQIDATHLGIPVSLYISQLVGKYIKGETSGVKAIVENYIEDVESENNNFTLYVKYQSSSETDFTTSTFVDGENLIILENISYSGSVIRADSSFATTIINGSVGSGSAAKIQEGVYFIRGFFIDVQSQTVILDQYDNNPSYRVGLFIDESIVVASQNNPDLYDNARGFSNFAAPGADRLRITTTLIKKSIDDFNDEDFVELLRVEDGVIKKFSNESNYSLITDELARRTYDESGDYYVVPFKVFAKESLNNRLGNNGVFLENQLTKQSNIPSDDLLCLQISPGKAYVRGYEVETINTVSVDLPKPRTTEGKNNVSIPFTLGKQLELNNVYGSVPVGFGSTSEVVFYSDRTSTPGLSSGLPIGVGRIYDLKLKNAEYTDKSTKFEASLFDIQTYNYVNLNTPITLSKPALIRGKNSNASGYLLSDVNNSNQIILYQVSGSFSVNESITINDQEENSRTIVSVRDYGISDIKQIVGNNGISTFTADTILSQTILLSSAGSNYSITSGSGGISTVTTSNRNFYVGINTGDIVSYFTSGNTVPTYNRVKQVVASSRSLILEATTNVVGVSSGSLPTSNVTVTNLAKVTPQILNLSDAYLFATLEDQNIANIDLNNSDFVIRKSYPVTIVSGGLNLTLESDNDYTLEPFDEEDYNLTFSNGIVESLNSQKLTVSGRTVILQNISTNGSAILTATLKKQNAKSKSKVVNKCSVLVISGSSSRSSGIGSTTLNDGLTYNQFYGTRVQDKDICLNVPDVVGVLGVFEASDASDPDLPKLNLTNLNSNILNSIRGELILGQKSQAAAFLVEQNGTNQIQFVYANENVFIEGENISFSDSGITATIQTLIAGDRDIFSDYFLNYNQKLEYADYSFITRREGTSPPTKKLKIVFSNYSIDPTDTGDFVTANSYPSSSSSVMVVGPYSSNDIIDVRPRVTPYDLSTATASPFEFKSRSFSASNNSSPHNLAKDKSINLSYSYYLGRIDKLYVGKDGKFFVNSGVPSVTPKIPNTIDSALEIATITLPPYVNTADEVKIILSEHKRYRMKDISRIDSRLKNVEYYTSLSLLETDTKNLTLRDESTQLDRFKCGFFVDNFKSIFGGNISDSSYKCSIDTVEGQLRSQHYTTSIDLLLGSEAVIGSSNVSNPQADLRFVKDLGSPNIKKVGDVVCLNYSDVVYVENRFATRSENVNPFAVVNWIGAIELNPSTDTWVETRTTQRTIDMEGSYQSAVQQLGVDTNTGLSPIDWGAWETDWVGTQEISRTNLGQIFAGSEEIGRSVTTGSQTWEMLPNPTLRQLQQRNQLARLGIRAVGGNFEATNARGNNFLNRFPPVRGRFLGIPETTTTTFRDSFTNFQNVTTLTTTNQSRRGIQFSVGERFDTTSLGPSIVSNDVIHTMRSRNIEFIARRLKPNTRVYSFFDNVNMSRYTLPKLIEIAMVSGAFSLGETVQGTSGPVSVRFRLAQANHKYGPYNNPTQVFVQNPYNTAENISTSYSSTSTILNVDTASLELQSSSGFYGYVVENMQLVGQSSGAVATVRSVRLITDNAGTLIGSLFIPDSTAPSAPRFETGTKTFSLTSSDTNSTVVGTVDSTAETSFVSSGTLNNVEDRTLRIRNADISRDVRTDTRTLTEQRTNIQSNTTFSNRTTTQTRWVDPLAQSFEVPDPNGVFITKCDVYFRTKDTTGLPVTMQIRTMQTGLPTQTILPFAEVVLEPEEVNLSNDASVPTTFTFPSPVYLETGNAYCVVLLSASNSYTVWISRMGETDVSTVNLAESQRIIVSQQPLLGSLFKSQNGATWDPSQLEDLKLKLYRAEFYQGESAVRFYNPDLDVGNNQIVTLRPNPLECVSRSSLVGIAKSLTSTEVGNLTPGVTILQNGNTTFSAKLKSIVGSIGIGSTLSITSVGSGFTSSSITYSNVNLIALSGRGTGGKVNLTVSGGVAIAATVSIGGTGYAYGDSLTVDYSQTGNFGKNLILTIPNNVGIISSFNSLLLDNIQGRITQDTTSALFYVGTAGTGSLSGATVNYNTNLTDGLHFKVNHNNHGMYSLNDYVILSSLESDNRPQTLNSSYSSSSTSNLVLSSVGIFTSFENLPVSATNPGYLLVGDEIIRYTGVITSTNSLTGITRGIDSTVPSTYSSSQQIFKYELNGVSLRRINKQHNLSNTDISKYPSDLDYYYIKVGMSTNGVDRTFGNANGFPELFFKETKTCGSYEPLQYLNSNRTAKATQNIPFNLIRPNIQTITPQGTSISAKIRTFSGGSPDNNSLTAFVDQGFEDISLVSNNFLTSPRIICSKVNEDNYLQDFPGRKSFTMEFSLSTTDSKVSPMIDLDRVSVVTVGNRLNSKISNYATDPRVNSLRNDPSACSYVTKIVRLEKGSDNLKVFFDAYRNVTNDIRVMYRLFRSDTDVTTQLYELFPGYDNLDENGEVINPANNNGRPDKFVSDSSLGSEFKSYEFTAKNLPLFNGFQIKIIMTGTNTSFTPLIRDLRVIATI